MSSPSALLRRSATPLPTTTASTRSRCNSNRRGAAAGATTAATRASRPFPSGPTPIRQLKQQVRPLKKKKSPISDDPSIENRKLNNRAKYFYVLSKKIKLRHFYHVTMTFNFLKYGQYEYGKQFFFLLNCYATSSN